MWFRIQQYFLFLVKATNQHGVHSPFVYDLLTKGLYPKNKALINFSKSKKEAHTNSRTLQLLCLLSAYFKPQHILLSNTCTNNVQQCLSYGAKQVVFEQHTPHFAPLQKQNTVYDMVYFNHLHHPQNATHTFYQCLSTAHSNTVLVVDHIRATKSSFSTWCVLCKHPKATVSIDLFSVGLIFFRKEQTKEHFTLRV